MWICILEGMIKPSGSQAVTAPSSDMCRCNANDQPMTKLFDSMVHTVQYVYRKNKDATNESHKQNRHEARISSRTHL